MPNGKTIQSPKSSPRDVFLYLLATITLYFSVFSAIDLLFGYINIVFPDPLNPVYDAGASIRWSLALFIVIFPVFFFTSRFLEKDIAADHDKNEIKIRKWLLYLTLFLAALLIIGDLVALLNTFLNGEITVRFLLKVAATLLVAGAVLWYYWYDLRKEPGTFSKQAKIFVWIIIGAYFAVAISGLLLAGSPAQQRELRFDSQRTNDLQSIQYQVLNYWTQKGKLPRTLGDLTDPISGFNAPVDPETNAEYQYAVVSTSTFQLCATFDLPSSANQAAPSMPIGPYPAGGTFDNWSHGAGHECFLRHIDSQLYPPKAQTSVPATAK